MTLLEMHVYDNFEDDIDDDDQNAVGIPYVVTVDYDNENIVSIRRNWREEDDMKKKEGLVCFL